MKAADCGFRSRPGSEVPKGPVFQESTTERRTSAVRLAAWVIAATFIHHPDRTTFGSADHGDYRRTRERSDRAAALPKTATRCGSATVDRDAVSTAASAWRAEGKLNSRRGG